MPSHIGQELKALTKYFAELYDLVLLNIIEKKFG